MALSSRVVDDPRSLRALAHPLRQQILRRLHRDGPATSAMLARELGQDRGATSFHLRQLGTYGFIVVDAERSTGRLKYWRALQEDLRFPSDPAHPAAADSAAVVSQLWRDALATLIRFYERGDAWIPESELSHATLHLTQDQLSDLTREYMALLARYRSPLDDAPDDVRPVIALFAAFASDDGDDAA